MKSKLQSCEGREIHLYNARFLYADAHFRYVITVLYEILGIPKVKRILKLGIIYGIKKYNNFRIH